jgi:hypothetical protein
MQESFGQRVRRLREERKIGLREAAAKVGISPTYLSRVERGSGDASVARNSEQSGGRQRGDEFSDVRHGAVLTEFAGNIAAPCPRMLVEPAEVSGWSRSCESGMYCIDESLSHIRGTNRTVHALGSTRDSKAAQSRFTPCIVCAKRGAA